MLAFFSGGYDVKPQLLATAVAFCVLGALVAVTPWPPARGRGLAAVAALAGLAIWTGASIGWAPIRNAAAEETAQLTLYAVAFGAALLALPDPPTRRWAAPALLAGVVVVAVYSLSGRLLPDVFPVEFSSRAGARIQQPLTYWNALGLLMAFGVLLGIALCSALDRSLRSRVVACAATVPCALVLYLTFSRGSLVAVAAGYAALLLTRPGRGALLAGPLVLAAGLVLVALLQLFPAVLELDRGVSEQTRQGAVVAVLTLGVAASAAGAFARLAGRSAFAGPLELRAGARRALAGASLVAVVALAWLIVASAERAEPLSSSRERLTTITTNRGNYWEVAFRTLGDNPLTGAGAASFMVEWRRERTSDEFAVDAHSLYIETLGELGLVGGALLATFLVLAVGGLVRRAASGVPDPIVCAATACTAAFLVHVGLDWTWEFPAVTLIPLLLLAGALAPGEV